MTTDKFDGSIPALNRYLDSITVVTFTDWKGDYVSMPLAQSKQYDRNHAMLDGREDDYIEYCQEDWWVDGITEDSLLALFTVVAHGALWDEDEARDALDLTIRDAIVNTVIAMGKIRTAWTEGTSR